MSCADFGPWLGAYADGELSGLRGWRVRRHLQACEVCAQEMRELSRLRQVLLDADLAPSPLTGPRTRGGSQPIPLRRMAVAGALALAAAIITLTGPSRSYGDPLQRAIAVLASAPAWSSSHVVVRDRAGKRVREQWVLLPDTLRDEVLDDGRLKELTVQLGRRTTRYRVEQKRAVRGDGNLYLPEPLGVGLAHGPINGLRRLQKAAKKVDGVSVTERTQAGADGRPHRVFTVEIDVARHYPGDPALRGVQKLRQMVYVDVATGRLARWEDAQSGLTYEVDRYNESFPMSLFTWSPPPGTHVAEFNDWWAARAGRTVGTEATGGHDITVHAVDAAANGDVWVTVSRRAPEQPVHLHDWPARGMVAQDERGRAYIHFVTRGNAHWPNNAALLGFTPVKPSAPNEPRPRKLTVRLLPEHRPHQKPVNHLRELVVIRNLQVPDPASWETPPLSVMDLLDGKSPSAEWMESRRGQARRAYRVDNPCGAFG